MWFIDTDNIVKVIGLRNAETLEYINDAAVTGVVYQLPALKPDAGNTAVNVASGKVGILCTGHGLSAGDEVRLERSRNYNGDFTLLAETTTNMLVISATYVVETFIGNEFIYEAVVGTSASPIVFHYISDSDGNYAGTVPNTTNFIQGQSYVMCIKEVSGLEQVLAKITDVAGFVGLT